jgi:hypothetical protein
MGYFIGEIINFPPPSLKNKKIKKKVFNFFYKYAFSRLLAQSKCMCINAFTHPVGSKSLVIHKFIESMVDYLGWRWAHKTSIVVMGENQGIILKLETRRTT